MDPIRTERLRLRRFDTGDADNLLALHNDPLVMRWINGGEATPRTVIGGRTLPAFIADNQEHTWGGFHAAEDPVTGAFLGWFSLSRPDADETQCSLGYRLARSAWGRGLATEGAVTLLGLAFATTALERVTATTYQENLGSRRVLDKLGFELVRRFRPSVGDLLDSKTAHTGSANVWDGDELEYALARSMWQSRRA